MSQTSFLGWALLIGFVIYITAKGNLPRYFTLLFRARPDLRVKAAPFAMPGVPGSGAITPWQTPPGGTYPPGTILPGPYRPGEII